MRSFDLSAVLARQIYDLAIAFVDGVREACVERGGAFEAIRAQNAATPAWGGACATHDFFDANMIMEAAFVKVVGRDAWLGSAVEAGLCTEAQAAYDLELWNAAWLFARSTRMI